MQYTVCTETCGAAGVTRRRFCTEFQYISTGVVRQLDGGACNGRILLVNPHQSSRSTFSQGSLLSFFAFKEGMLGTPISVLGGWPTVSDRFLRLQRGHRLHLWYIGKRTLVEMLTVRRVRHITLASSWRPARTGNTQGAQPPDNPASMG